MSPADAEPVVRLFGPVTAVVDGREVALGGARQRAVLAWLALQVGRPVSVDGIVAAVWGDDPPPTVANTLQVYVSALRRALRGSGLEIARTGSSYRLAAGLDDVDAARLERLASEGRAALRGGEPERAVARLREGLSWWRAEPFAGLADRPFAAAAAAELHRVRLGAGLDLGAALCALGRADEAVAEARRLQADHPYDEACWELTISALYHAGRQADALAAYREAAQVLADDLGLDPSDRLTALQAAVLAHTLASPVPPTAADPPPASGPLDTVVELVGREELAAEVADLLARARLVTLAGLGGVGKTALALTVGRMLREGGAEVELADVSAATTAEQAAELICVAAGVDPGTDPVAALTSTDRDLVVVVDNAEQVDGADRLLADVLRSAAHLRVLVTSRVALGIRGEHLVAVPPLSAPAAAVLFARRAAEVQPGIDLAPHADTVGRLCRLAGDLPLAVEIVASRLRSTAITDLAESLHDRGSGVLDLAGPADLPERQRTVRTVVAWAVDRVSPDAARALSRLALVTGPITGAMVRRVIGADGDDPDHAPSGEAVDDAVAELVAAALLEGPDGRGRVRVAEPVAELVIARADPATRAGDEGRLVDVVVATAAEADGIERLRADQPTVDSALVLSGRLADPVRCVALLTGLLRYSLVADRTAHLLRYADRVRGLAVPPTASAELAATAQLATGMLAARFSRGDAVELLTAALDAAAGLGLDPELVVNGWCYLGSVHCMGGDVVEGRRCADEASRAAGEDVELVTTTRDFSSLVSTYEGDHERSVELILEALVEARRRDDDYVIVELLQRAAEPLMELGRHDEADRFLDEAFALSRTVSIGPLATRLVGMRSMADIALGRPAAAMGHASEVIRMSREGQSDPMFEYLAVRTLAAARALVCDPAGSGELDGAATALFADVGIGADEMWTGPLRAVLEPARESAEHRAAAVLGGAVPRQVVDRWLEAVSR